MKRAKYKAKNINEFKRLRECTVPFCKELGFVSYRNDSEKDDGGIKVEHRCIPHVHWVKPAAVAAARNPNLYRKCDDIAKLLSLANYNTTREVWKHGTD